jgi:hypothetical protein
MVSAPLLGFDGMLTLLVRGEGRETTHNLAGIFPGVPPAAERPVNSSAAFPLFCMVYHFAKNIETLEFTGRSDRLIERSKSSDRALYCIVHSPPRESE